MAGRRPKGPTNKAPNTNRILNEVETQNDSAQASMTLAVGQYRLPDGNDLWWAGAMKGTELAANQEIGSAIFHRKLRASREKEKG